MDRWTCSLSPERQRQRRRGRIAIHWECTGWLLREEGQWLVSTGGCEVLSCYISASSSPPCLSLSLSRRLPGHCYPGPQATTCGGVSHTIFHICHHDEQATVLSSPLSPSTNGDHIPDVMSHSCDSLRATLWTSSGFMYVCVSPYCTPVM